MSGLHFTLAWILVSKLCRVLATASIIGWPMPVIAQEMPLRPQLDDARLWLSDQNELPRLLPGTRLSPPPAPAFLRSHFTVGYVVGGLIGLRLSETETPPKELGLWLRGWYEGSATVALLDQPDPGFSGRTFLDVSTSHSGAEPPFVDGLVRGFLHALAITSR